EAAPPGGRGRRPLHRGLVRLRGLAPQAAGRIRTRRARPDPGPARGALPRLAAVGVAWHAAGDGLEESGPRPHRPGAGPRPLVDPGHAVGARRRSGELTWGGPARVGPGPARPPGASRRHDPADRTCPD